ncbi:MAG: beta-propeller fold lactonase family protein [Verrucomicrobia bacterium]|nr:beta-propeller fold lactonase family protein [Verrucomicrobiota bacterium]
MLSRVQHIGTGGLHPRNFTLDPTGRYLLVANMNSDNIVVFSRDIETGRLVDTGHRAAVSMPICLVWGVH